MDATFSVDQYETRVNEQGEFSVSAGISTVSEADLSAIVSELSVEYITTNSTTSLEEMGVSPPEVDDSGNQDGIGLIPNDVTLPDLIPSIPTLKSEKVGQGKMRLMTLFFGIFGLIGTVINVVIGGGYVLCSVGLANYNGGKNVFL